MGLRSKIAGLILGINPKDMELRKQEIVVYKEEIARLSAQLEAVAREKSRFMELYLQKDMELKESKDRVINTFMLLERNKKIKDYGVSDLHENKILAYLNEINHYCTPKDLEPHLRLRKDTIGKKLSQMTKKGLLRRLGQGRNIHYKLP